MGKRSILVALALLLAGLGTADPAAACQRIAHAWNPGHERCAIAPGERHRCATPAEAPLQGAKSALHARRSRRSEAMPLPRGYSPGGISWTGTGIRFQVKMGRSSGRM
jgi:hypothetical protein